MGKAVKFHFFDRLTALEQLSSTLATRDEVAQCRNDLMDRIEHKVDAVGDRIISKMDDGFVQVHNRIDNHLERREGATRDYPNDRRTD